MTTFSQNPISPPNRFGTSPRNPRDAADAIMAYLDREAAGTSMPRTPFAPFLAETYEAPVGGGEGEGGYPTAAFDAPYAFDRVGVEEQEATEFPLPYPDAQSDDERIENVMWLLESKPVASPEPGNDLDEAISFNIDELVDLAGWTEAADSGHKLPPGKFRILKAIADLAVAQGIGAMYVRRVYDLRVKRLERLEPDNSLLKAKGNSNPNPTLDDVEKLRDEIMAAERRHAARGLAVPTQPRGDSERAATGTAAHRFHKLDTQARGGKGNVQIGQAGRADSLFRTYRGKRERIDELKPKDQLKRAEIEAEAYAKERTRLTRRPTDWRGVTYDEQELWDRFRRDLIK